MFSRMLMPTITALATLGGPASAADHIKLGYMATLSGPFAMVGEEQQRGLNLALEELGNKLGGVPVTLSTADDKGSPPEAVAAAAKLIERDKVEIVTGMMNSATTIATMKAYENAASSSSRHSPVPCNTPARNVTPTRSSPHSPMMSGTPRWAGT
jgi:branched-chain amino acid transport system substrate-binding protein